MIEQIKHIEDLTVIHWFLAFAGLAVHVLMKLGEVQGAFFANIKRKEVFTIIASMILVPIILIVCTDSSVKQILPINYVTAFLAGYQTQSFVRSIAKFSKTNRDENS
jgi:hypothetical protein